MKHRHNFAKKHRIYRYKDFQDIFKRGKRFRQPHLMGIINSNDLGYQRLGISIGRKFGKAHQRNYFKRLVREAFRTFPLRENMGLDIVIVPNNSQKTLQWWIIQREVTTILHQGMHWLSQNKK